MSEDFDMELRQPVSLQHILEREEKKKKQPFSALADWPRDDILNKMQAKHKRTDKQKGCTACSVGVVGSLHTTLY